MLTMTLTPKEKKIPFSVSDAYPNPCTESTRLLFSVSEKSRFTVSVLENDVELLSQNSEDYLPGIATMDVLLGGLPSGHYSIRVMLNGHFIDKHIQKVQKRNKKG
ncbi:MAG: hypothetical protein J0L62_00030 [Bacteroidetes bacterium]|nr:hypothetical protein [Bacteroidota bacterium]